MFTGIVEALGCVIEIHNDRENKRFVISAPFVQELKIDQSLAHNGVCLTVVEIKDECYAVDAIKETLIKSNLNRLQIGDFVNLERCMKLGDRLDGHLVQGHVDTVANCKSIENQNGSWLYTFDYEADSKHITVEKGSICVNGVSLTVVHSKKNSFSAAIIPYTFEHTTFQHLKVGDTVNLEFDIIGKYILQSQSLAK